MDKEVAMIARLMSSAKQLQHINLCNCGFQFNGMHLIIEVLKANTKLEHLDLSLNGNVSHEDKNTSATNDMFEQIIDVMLRNSIMRYFKLPQIHLSNEQLQCLLQIVTSKNSFACIGLGPNTVNDKLAGNLDAILSNSKLE